MGGGRVGQLGQAVGKKLGEPLLSPLRNYDRPLLSPLRNYDSSNVAP